MVGELGGQLSCKISNAEADGATRSKELEAWLRGGRGSRVSADIVAWRAIWEARAGLLVAACAKVMGS